MPIKISKLIVHIVINYEFAPDRLYRWHIDAFIDCV